MELSRTQSSCFGKLRCLLPYVLGGAGFGLAFPLIASLIQILSSELPLNISSFMFVQRTEVLLWIIDLAVPVIAGAGALVRWRQVRILHFNSILEEKVSERTVELENLLRAMDGEMKERLRIEKDLRSATQAAETAVRVKSDFLASMSHEIRTPMNGILGMLEILDHGNLNKDQQHHLETIRESGEYLLMLLNDVLDASQIETNKVALQEEAFSLRGLFQKTILLISEKAEDKGLGIRFEIENGCPDELRGDSNRIRQILLNLLGNAVKFSEKGEIVVRVRQEGAVNESVRLRVEVSDTGIGIPKSKQGEIFDKFIQVDSSSTRGYGGAGLGLAICRRLCELMKGEIGVESVEGEGSTFWFQLTLPIEKSKEPELPKALPHRKREELETSSPLHKARILVVDDNAVNQKVATLMLKKLGCSVFVAENGKQAVELVESDPFDVILMDCHMPVMDGFEATRTIRENENGGARIPILAMTASTLSSDRQACFTAGMDDHISKPVNSKILSDKLSQWIEKKSPLEL